MSVGLTRSRCINALRCYVNYALSLFGLVRSTHMPTFVSIEPANVCQLRCPACPVGRLDIGMPKTRNSERFMSMEVFRRVLEEVTPYAHTMQFYFQGEPLLNKDLPEMIRQAHEAGLYTILSTNAQAMTETMAEALVKAGLDRIIISMDGITDESYNAYRIGGSLEKTKAAIQYLRKAKDRTPLIELQCLRLKTNEHEWADFKRQYKAFGADRLVFKTTQLYDYEEGHPLMPTDNKYSRYTKGTGGRYHRKALHRGCLRVWSGVVITTTGEVLPCCYDKAHEHAYGNIMESSLCELFTSEKANAFRKAALQETPKICQECWR